MTRISKVPDAWWRRACEVIHHPLACVSQNNGFVWANMAFERLVGYSLAELKELTWMDITIQEHVGGDLASVQAVVRGDSDMYCMTKTYKHKSGHDVPVEVTVWRFPPSVGDFACFVVEAMPESATIKQLSDVHDRLRDDIRCLQGRLLILEKETMTSHGDHQENRSNNTNVIRTDGGGMQWIALAFTALIAAVMYLIYIGGWGMHRGDAEPPQSPIQQTMPLEESLK